MDTLGTYVVVPFISGAFNVLIDRLAPEEMRRTLMGKDSTVAQLSHLRRLMMVVSKVINDAGEKQDADFLVRTWLGDVKDALYDAEDLVDEIHTQALQARVEADIQSSTLSVDQVLSSIAAGLSRIAVVLDPFHRGIESRIEEICRRFEGFVEQIDLFGLTARVGKPQTLASLRLPSTSLVDESKIYGRDSEREKIMKVLRDAVEEARGEQNGLIRGKVFVAPRKSKINVVAIVGMPGIGKTTLAQSIFNDSRVDEMFDFKAWIHVPEVFDVFQITSSILDLLPSPSNSFQRYFHSSTSDRSNLELIQRSLRERMAGKRFLIVLDDVWDENLTVSWNALLLSLHSAAGGSTIIVTTCNEDIARVIHPIFTLPLQELHDDDCWSMIKLFAFGDPLVVPDAQFQVFGRQIVLKCGGLPLAAKALGGLLSLTSDALEWEEIANSRIWDLPAGCKEILPALLLSYNYLPNHLKRCFAYCSIFPKNHQFEKENLVLLWMAEGLIEQASNDDRRIEYVGNIYFHDLRARSFFQESSSKKHFFVMHDLIHDLAVYVMGEFGFMLKSNISHVSDRTHHFSYMRSRYETAEKFSPLTGADCLRTFLPLRSSSTESLCYICSNMLKFLEPSFSRLRVLSLCHYNITTIPPSIGNLKHLRYLDLSSTLIEVLPEFVGTLYNLQTLLLSNCCRLKLLPMKISNLIGLRHLDISETRWLQEMPENVRRLRDLQRLTDFVVGKMRGANIRELGELCHLRGGLHISRLENVVAEADALAANLRDKVHLDELVLQWSRWYVAGDTERERLVLNALQPWTNLKRLTVWDYKAERFPDWVGNGAFINLEVLHLQHCPNCTLLPPVGQLPCLKYLLVHDFSRLRTVGLEFYGQNLIRPFKSLESLKFIKLPQWSTWSNIEAGCEAFPRLQELCLWNCPVLEGSLPVKLPSLETLDIRECGMLSGSLPQLPHLSELKLDDWGSLDVRNLAGLSSLTSISLCWRKRVENAFGSSDSFTSAKAAISHMTSLENLTMMCGYSSHHIYPKSWFIPRSVRLVTVSRLDEAGAFITSPCLHYLCIKDSSYPFLRNSVSHSQMLNFLTIFNCFDLEEFLFIPGGYGLEFFSLYDLSIQRCPRLANFRAGGFVAANLTTLSIHDCKVLRSLPDRMPATTPSLQFLSIDNCPLLESFPEDGLPPNLQTLRIQSCHGVRSLPEDLSTCMSLQFLSVSGCPKLILFPTSGLPPNLCKLHISCCRNLKSLPERIHRSQNLELLCISECPDIKSFPQGGLPPNLEILEVRKCDKLISTYVDWQINQLVCLKELAIEGCKDAECFPRDGSLPISLTLLSIDNFPKLVSINCLELRDLPCIRELEIKNCPLLLSFSDDLPQSICRLAIERCPEMVKRCRGSDGLEVHKISHITCFETSY